MSLPFSFTPLAQWLTLIVAALQKAAAARAGRDHAVAPLVTLLWTRLARLTARFDARRPASQPDTSRPNALPPQLARAPAPPARHRPPACACRAAGPG